MVSCNMDDYGILGKTFEFLLSALGIVAAWLMRNLYKDINGLKDRSQKQSDDLSNFKTLVSDTYSKEAITQASLARIHERIDKMGDSTDAKLTVIADDIKELLKQGR